MVNVGLAPTLGNPSFLAKLPSLLSARCSVHNPLRPSRCLPRTILSANHPSPPFCFQLLYRSPVNVHSLSSFPRVTTNSTSQPSTCLEFHLTPSTRSNLCSRTSSARRRTRRTRPTSLLRQPQSSHPLLLPNPPKRPPLSPLLLLNPHPPSPRPPRPANQLPQYLLLFPPRRRNLKRLLQPRLRRRLRPLNRPPVLLLFPPLLKHQKIPPLSQKLSKPSRPRLPSTRILLLFLPRSPHPE